MVTKLNAKEAKEVGYSQSPKVMKEHQRATSSCVRGSITGSYRGCYLTRVNRKHDCRNGIGIPEEIHSL